MTTAYCTVAELKAQVDKTGAGDDTVITAIVLAASNAIDRFCNRPDGFVALALATARTYAGNGKGWMRIDECTSVSAVAVKDSPSDTTYTAWVASDYILFSGDIERPDFNSLPYTGIMTDPNGDYSMFTGGKYTTLKGFAATEQTQRTVPTVQITATWGYAATVPSLIKEVCIIQAARWYKRGQSGHADILSNAGLGTLTYPRALDDDLRKMLMGGRYIRPAIG